MSFFFNRTCPDSNCKISFCRTHDLILHIEQTHIDFQQSLTRRLANPMKASTPLSLILPYDRGQFVEEPLKICEAPPLSPPALSPPALSPPALSPPTLLPPTLTPDNASLNSGGLSSSPVPTQPKKGDNTTPAFDAAAVVREATRWGLCGDRPFVCPIPGCTKNYKNPNGIKYHALFGHSHDKKNHCSICGKYYKSQQSLQAHCNAMHGIKKKKASPRQSSLKKTNKRQPLPKRTSTRVQVRTSPPVLPLKGVTTSPVSSEIDVGSPGSTSVYGGGTGCFNPFAPTQTL